MWPRLACDARQAMSVRPVAAAAAAAAQVPAPTPDHHRLTHPSPTPPRSLYQILLRLARPFLFLLFSSPPCIHLSEPSVPLSALPSLPPHLRTSLGRPDTTTALTH